MSVVQVWINNDCIVRIMSNTQIHCVRAVLMLKTVIRVITTKLETGKHVICVNM